VIRKVVIAKQAQRDLARVPAHIATKLAIWIEAVETDGLEEVRRIPGYHDEPLRGQRSSQRSVRLNRAYRAIYVTATDGTIAFVSVEEVSKHDY